MLESDRFVWVDDIIASVLCVWADFSIDLADARRWLAPRPLRDLPFVVVEEVKDLGPGFRVALGVCAGIALVCGGVMLLGGSNFAEGTLGRHVMIIGMGFFAIMFVLVYAAAKS